MYGGLVRGRLRAVRTASCTPWHALAFAGLAQACGWSRLGGMVPFFAFTLPRSKVQYTFAAFLGIQKSDKRWPR